ncbi:epoxyqueuosine reductase QueH [Lachnoclostridium sp. Marseille-P6806]|uniref:epoxyqueuosine reductase QueH n=1 Tax=Lachnoclostridium sp. Marseille-P6806 TaxID=2364793 RepID=UPI0010317CD1|nr:epoxyqueuosine reductase QueH [Lachnoclostridium sp. Marseille-P6806]
MNKRNFRRETENIIGQAQREGRTPTLLVHVCCAPCSSYCLEFLREFFRLTVYYYNPNITADGEYERRKEEERRLIAEYNRQVEEASRLSSPEERQAVFTRAGMNSTPAAQRIEILEAPYDPERFLSMAAGFEDAPEGGERCTGCFALRLNRTAEAAWEHGFDFFTTTLTISPRKDASRLNAIGERAAEKIRSEHPGSRLSFLPSDFKKRDGYLRSIRLSEQYGLYRQDYCGCEFSRGRGYRNEADTGE